MNLGWEVNVMFILLNKTKEAKQMNKTLNIFLKFIEHGFKIEMLENLKFHKEINQIKQVLEFVLLHLIPNPSPKEKGKQGFPKPILFGINILILSLKFKGRNIKDQ